VSRRARSREHSWSGGHLPEDVYALVAASVPILCVDLVPRFAGDPARPYRLISRRDHKGDTGWCWIGGRVWIDERLGEAAARHLRQTLGANVSMRDRDWSRPDLVVDFERSERTDRPQDSRKHSVSLAWVVDSEGEPEPIGEASAIGRFGLDSLPPDSGFAFGLGPVIRRLVASDSARRHGEH
jgi:ADP-ribose pyrophosphatase YjhB (NUDIX family)